MSPTAQVALFSALIVLGALVGAWVALQIRRDGQITTFLAFAAGIMLGAAFFHMLPEAYEGSAFWTFALVPMGFLALFLLERYVLVHACEEPPDCAEHVHGPGPAIGLAAFLGMSVHTLFDGIALGSAAKQGVGTVAFIAILCHKIPSSLSLAAIFRSEHRSPRAILLYSAAFGLMVPIGAALFFLFDAVVPIEHLAARAVAFSAGTFLYIAVSDLLPHVNRHGKERRGANVAALIAGLALTFIVALLAPEPHGH